MIKIKYVGLKTDGERAFKEHTGIEWFPGSEHEVKEEHAAMMLRHPDVFEQVTGKPVAPAKDGVMRTVATDDLDADDEAIRREESARAAKAEAEVKAKPPEVKPPETKPAGKPAAKKTAAKSAKKK